MIGCDCRSIKADDFWAQQETDRRSKLSSRHGGSRTGRDADDGPPPPSSSSSSTLSRWKAARETFINHVRGTRARDKSTTIVRSVDTRGGYRAAYTRMIITRTRKKPRWRIERRRPVSRCGRDKVSRRIETRLSCIPRCQSPHGRGR